MTTLTVGTGKEYATIGAAVAATRDGDTVLVQAGTYTNDFFSIGHKITLQSVGGQATLVATTSPSNGKAIVTVDADVTIDGFGFTGAAVGDNNGAGIRYEGGNMVVRNSVFWNNQEGILGAAIPNGTVVIQNSEFSDNGAGDGFTHNLYIGAVASLLVEGSYFHDSVVGHEIKSRALSTTIINNRIEDEQGDGSYSIDLPNGGIAVVQGNTIEKGVNAENYTTITFGEEGAYAGSSLSVTGNTLVNDNANGVLLKNAAGSAPVALSNNAIWGYAAANIAVGAVSQSGNVTLAARPTLDVRTVAPPVLPPPVVPVTTVVPTDTHLQSFGRGGDVVASGRVLTVGAGGQFSTLAEALTVSQDGDTIKVAAGTYLNDFGTISHKVIIEGVGGIAHFVQNVYGSQGMLKVTTDATLANLEFSGAHDYNGHEGGIFVAGGNVTVVNSKFDNNDIGVWAVDNPGTTLSIYGSEIGPNGNYAKGTHNVEIGAVGSFTLVGSYVHGAITGHELYDRAYNTDIEQSRIIDGAGVGASFSIDLGEGGNALIKNNVIEKGVNSANSVLVSIGGEGPAYSNTNVEITGNTLVSDVINPDHPYTYFVVGHDASATPAPIDASYNTFFGGVPGSAQLLLATGTNNVTTTTHPVLDTASPVSASLAPALFGAPTVGPNVLSLKLSETKGAVDGQFVVAVDGVTIGGGTVTADTATQAPQTFGFNGWWGVGSHTVTITGTDLTDATGPRVNDIAIAGISLDGAVAGPQQSLISFNLSDTVTLAGTPALPDFDAAYYLAHNPDVKAAGVDPLQHYLNYGWREGRNPDAFFNTRFYLVHNPDVAASGMNPLQHYEEFGWKEGRDPSALFDTALYEHANPSSITATWDPIFTYMHSGLAPTEPTSTSLYAQPEPALFDTTYYLAHNPDVAAANVDPLLHYQLNGWHEGRNPSAAFDTRAYLAANPDVAAAGIDPLAEYAVSGRNEGRLEFAVHS